MRRTILSYGETLWDLLPTGAVLGGAPFNFVYRANSLGDRGLIVTRLGRDELGRQAWERSVALGLATQSIPECADAMMAGWSLAHCVITFGEAGAFAAGFIHRLLRERSIGECCDLGNALGAMAAAQEGGTVPISPDDVGRFLAGEHERIVKPELAHFPQD